MLDELDAVIAGLAGDGLGELLRQRLVKSVFVPAPGAGQDWTAAVPGGVVWELLSVRYRLSTSAVVANRTPQLRIRDADSNEAFRIYAGTSQAAGSVTPSTYAAGLGSNTTSFAVAQALPSPPFLIPAGGSVGTNSGNLDVGDAFDQIVLRVREWSVDQVRQAREWLERNYK